MDRVHSNRLPDWILAQPPAFSAHELAKKVSAIDAQQIEALAKSVIAAVMARMAIPSSLETRCDSDYKFMGFLLPVISKQIRESFSNPDSFLEFGIEFEVSKMIDVILLHDSQSFSSKSELQKAFPAKNPLTWKITLKLDRDRTQVYSKLHFERRELLDGNDISCISFHIKGCEGCALDGTASSWKILGLRPFHEFLSDFEASERRKRVDR